ncbi:hypothetical protein BYT27DRAFT_7218591 [Phlegmacium glaucopus]|nr:hypothetical protein BYT27DRAFT_7218591 [Phlegmacium glaucopus]
MALFPCQDPRHYTLSLGAIPSVTDPLPQDLQSKIDEGSTSSGKPPRNTKTRLEVCMRDKCCLITGQAAVKRARGGNFTGLEVAHIFPLMGVGNSTWTYGMAADAKAKVNTCKRADAPQNAILLRVDIHTLFDDYQWSLWPVTDKTVVRG